MTIQERINKLQIDIDRDELDVLRGEKEVEVFKMEQQTKLQRVLAQINNKRTSVEKMKHTMVTLKEMIPAKKEK